MQRIMKALFCRKCTISSFHLVLPFLCNLSFPARKVKVKRGAAVEKIFHFSFSGVFGNMSIKNCAVHLHSTYLAFAKVFRRVTEEEKPMQFGASLQHLSIHSDRFHAEWCNAAHSNIFIPVHKYFRNNVQYFHKCSIFPQIFNISTNV